MAMPRMIREVLAGREAFSVKPDMTITEVVDYLVDKGVGAVAVCEGSKAVGVFSERDLMRRVVKPGVDPSTTPVKDVMTYDVVAVPDTERHNLALALMIGKNFRHLAVVDEHERFLGFVSMRDLMEIDIAEAKELIRKLNDDYYHHEFETKRDQ